MLKNNLKKHDRNQSYQKVTSLTTFMIFIFMFVDFFENNALMKNDVLMKNQSIKNKNKKMIIFRTKKRMLKMTKMTRNLKMFLKIFLFFH